MTTITTERALEMFTAADRVVKMVVIELGLFEDNGRFWHIEYDSDITGAIRSSLKRLKNEAEIGRGKIGIGEEI